MKLLLVLIAERADLRGAAGAYLQEGGSRGEHGFPREARPEVDAK